MTRSERNAYYRDLVANAVGNPALRADLLQGLADDLADAEQRDAERRARLLRARAACN